MIKAYGACVINDKNQLLPYAVQPTESQCDQNAGKIFSADIWNKMKELGAKIVPI